jgi:hypothetical protein
MKTIILTRPCTDDRDGYHDTGESLIVPDQVNADRAAALVADGRAFDPDKAPPSDAADAGANALVLDGEGGAAGVSASPPAKAKARI